MEEDIVKIGMIQKRIMKEFDLPPEKSLVFILRRTLDEFVSHYPKDYLVKIAECKRILAHPFYATFDKKKKVLYLVKEYIAGNDFKKVAIAIDMKKQAHLIDLFLLNEKKTQEIMRDDMRWIIVSRKK